MKAAVTIRLCELKDTPAVKQIEESLALAKWSETDYRSAVVSRDYFFYVAESKDDKQITGFLLVRLIMNQIFNNPSLNKVKSKNSRCYPSITSRELEIINIGVKKEWQRKKIAHGLWCEFVQNIERGSYKIYLETRESNRKAIDFYEKQGFRIVGLRKNYYRQPDENALLLSLESIADI